jgi:phage terminase Nu1 subunit (DNA packaging protein)
MPVNITDVNDAILLAMHNQEKLVEEAFAEFFKPQQDAVMAMTMKNIPTEVKQRLKELAPDAMKKIEKRIAKK